MLDSVCGHMYLSSRNRILAGAKQPGKQRDTDRMTPYCNIDWKNALLLLCAALCFSTASATAQTSSGQLTITMNVQSSISLIFQNNPSVGTPGFCPLTNAGTTMASS